MREERTRLAVLLKSTLALVAQQATVYHHHNHLFKTLFYSPDRHSLPEKREKGNCYSFAPTYDPEPAHGINRGTGYDNQRAVNVAGARENVAVIGKQGGSGLLCKKADWLHRDSDLPTRLTELSTDQELEAHYMYMAKLKMLLRQFCTKPEFLKKAQRAISCLYDIGCYNDNLGFKLAPDSDKTIRLENERSIKSKADLIDHLIMISE
ncbi:hypothetical protein Tco_0312648 [Tanacetum coccineum]